jgi:DNA-directed RNA polymerase specialized sigma24 family protein
MTEDVSAHELLVRLKAEDMTAVDALYGRYDLVFYRYARSRGLTREEAEDALQTTFDRILTRIRTYDEDKGAQSGGGGWLWRVCHNAVVDVLRERDPVRPDSEHGISGGDAGVESDLDLTVCIATALEELAEEDRQELLFRDPGRGTGRREWHLAAARFRAALERCYGQRSSPYEGRR